jgi:hypothetical protein
MYATVAFAWVAMDKGERGAGRMRWVQSTTNFESRRKTVQWLQDEPSYEGGAITLHEHTPLETSHTPMKTTGLGFQASKWQAASNGGHR